MHAAQTFYSFQFMLSPKFKFLPDSNHLLCRRIFINSPYTNFGPGSSVSIATGYGLDGPGIESQIGTKDQSGRWMTEVEEEANEDGDTGERQGREQQDNASNRHTGRGHKQGELAIASIDTGGEGIECIVRVRVII
jgi:hypothetical protein